MELFDTMSDRGHEQVVFFQDRPTGLRAIVAIHSTVLGTLKGIEACCGRRFGHADLAKLSFGVQGVGHVGRHLVHRLRERGARVTVTDINAQRVQSVVDEYGAEAVPMQSVYDLDMDVFVPCALVGVINKDTVPRLKCSVVAGSANNQLESDAWGTALEERGILYAPDYVVNAGGLINVAIELQGYDKERAHRQVSLIYNNLERIFDIAERDGIPSWQAADRTAEERSAAVGRTELPYTRRFKDRLSGRAHHTTTTH